MPSKFGTFKSLLIAVLLAGALGLALTGCKDEVATDATVNPVATAPVTSTEPLVDTAATTTEGSVTIDPPFEAETDADAMVQPPTSATTNPTDQPSTPATAETVNQ